MGLAGKTEHSDVDGFCRTEPVLRSRDRIPNPYFPELLHTADQSSILFVPAEDLAGGLLILAPGGPDFICPSPSPVVKMSGPAVETPLIPRSQTILDVYLGVESHCNSAPAPRPDLPRTANRNIPEGPHPVRRFLPARRAQFRVAGVTVQSWASCVMGD